MVDAGMNPVTKLQVEQNRGSRDYWEVFAGHRRKVTALLGGPESRGSRLCVLGAGNCNDLDLNTLVDDYREVHLVDLDADALAAGVARLGLADDSRVQCHGDVDLTGMLDVLTNCSPHTEIRDADLAAWIEEPTRRMQSTLPGPFEIVASTCLLSQLIDAVMQTVGESHPRFLELVQAVRAGHLRLLTELIAPGGVGVLMTDVVSSDTVPDLVSVPERALSRKLVQLIRERNFFHGLNPAVLVSLLGSDPVLSSRVAKVEPILPWHWNFGPRCYAVCAMKVWRSADGTPASKDDEIKTTSDGGRL